MIHSVFHPGKDIVNVDMTRADHAAMTQRTETLEKIRDYAQGLRTWAKTNRESEIATDLLYLIGESK